MRKLFGLVLLLFLALPWAAMAEEAPEITQACTLQIGRDNRLTQLTDKKYTTCLTLRKKQELLIDGKGKALGGIFLQYYETCGACRIEVEEDGAWREVEEGGKHLTDWFPLPAGTRKAKVVNISNEPFRLAEVRVYGLGDQPREAARWKDAKKADLLLVSCHPDDELLWFGGLLATYAGQEGWSVQVAVTVPSMPYRRLELLDGLWHCGVTNYPVFFGFRDVFGYSLAEQYKSWRRSLLQAKIVESIRRFRPEVVVTHDLRGEYGHSGHKAVADCTVAAVSMTADAQQFPSSASEWGTWQPKKLYVHSYAENQVKMDWHVPLAAFEGKDGLQIATEALSYHKSQTSHGWAMEDGGPHDNSVFGLYMTQVGPDEAGNDLMEHIPKVDHSELENAEDLPADLLIVDETI